MFMRKLTKLTALSPIVFLLTAYHGSAMFPAGSAQAAEPSFDEQSADQAVPGQYVVVLRKGVVDVPGLAQTLTNVSGGTLLRTYGTALKGFAARLPDHAARALASHPDVAYVEPDFSVRLNTTQSNPANWGLDRIDQSALPLSMTYTYAASGSGVDVYIMDTGIRRTHVEFGGRANYVPNGSNGDFVGDGHGSAEDCQGHGTIVAGVVGSASFGVAKDATLWAARVVDCVGGGTVSMGLAAVDWITANARPSETGRPAVVNMSLNYGHTNPKVRSILDAIENSIAAGINYAIASGNASQNACHFSPGSAPNANTVGATDITDAEAGFSNYGTCIDILAPGVNITSVSHTSDVASIGALNGTSVASPHVAGVIAQYLQLYPGATPAQVSLALISNATLGAITMSQKSQQAGTPNRLLFTNY
jgi:subtilisin family serine protease